jgi:hypothetical protein
MNLHGTLLHTRLQLLYCLEPSKLNEERPFGGSLAPFGAVIEQEKPDFAGLCLLIGTCPC